MNKKYDEFVETEEREDIFKALEQLYDICLKGKELFTLDETLDLMDKVRGDW